ncbi:MAG: Fe-S-containing protein [Chloroflexia bacterium]
MSKTVSRAAKRARFATRTKRSHRLSTGLLLTGTLGLLVVGGVLALLLSRLLSGATDVAAGTAPLLNPGGSETPARRNVAAVAATYGHAPYPLVEAQDGLIRLPLSTFDDYRAHFYTYMHDGRPIEFFVVKSRDGIVRAAFNACDVCYPARKGYHQEGDVMVCNNCGRRFPTDQINIVRGGCNPAPLERSVEGDMLVIRVQDLLAGLIYF